MSTTEKIAEEVSVLMPKIARKVLIKFFQKVNLTQTQIFTIMTISERPSCQLHELKEKLEISAPTVTGIIDRLERSGHVRRVHDRDDRRVVHVSLTAKGRALVKRIKTTVKKKWGDLLGKLSKSDQENYVSILRKIQRNIQ